jgi:hypothetical protein
MAARAIDARRMTLLVRAYCHLCDDMRDALAPLADTFGWTVEEIDIDTDPVLERRWNEDIPVLLAGERVLCRHRFDATAVKGFLLEATSRG